MENEVIYCGRITTSTDYPLVFEVAEVSVKRRDELGNLYLVNFYLSKEEKDPFPVINFSDLDRSFSLMKGQDKYGEVYFTRSKGDCIDFVRKGYRRMERAIKDLVEKFDRISIRYSSELSIEGK